MRNGITRLCEAVEANHYQRSNRDGFLMAFVFIFYQFSNNRNPCLLGFENLAKCKKR
jgi:hypothetical protein